MIDSGHVNVKQRVLIKSYISTIKKQKLQDNQILLVLVCIVSGGLKELCDNFRLF